MNDDRLALQLLTRQTHAASLELLAAKAIADGDLVKAFQLADRRCRIAPEPMSHCYVLRARAAYGLGNRKLAIADLMKAQEIFPGDLTANRKLLAWGDRLQKLEAARNVVAHDFDSPVLREAITALIESGQPTLARADVLEREICGFVAWMGNADIEITLSSEDGSLTTILPPDPFHPLSSDATNCASFAFPRHPSRSPQIFTLACDGVTFYSRFIPASISATRRTNLQSNAFGKVTVIVPVYGDVDATRQCLDGLIADQSSSNAYRVVIVNDASSVAEIEPLLHRLSRLAGVEVLTNSANLGFVGSVGRALAEIKDGDVVLLNADTIVPSGFIERLSTAAHSAADIGIVVPLSNNGEFSSFPIPSVNNQLRDADDVSLFDRIAESCNKGETVDIPAGTGFCMYIKRACLQAVGGLSDSYYRGYFEDVDLCLRARQLGFRSVCAPSVFVGHIGSLSFSTEKRSLALRNFDVLKERFPFYPDECRAFEQLDPLRPFRASIERRLSGLHVHPILILTAPGPLDDIARIRAQELADDGEVGILIQMTSNEGRVELHCTTASGLPPQSLSFAVDDDADNSDLADYLRELEPSHCEIFAPLLAPKPLISLFEVMGLPFDLWIVDGAAFLARQETDIRKSGLRRAQTYSDLLKTKFTLRPTEILDGARRIIAPTAMAGRYLSWLSPQTPIVIRNLPDRGQQLHNNRHSSERQVIALIAGRPSAIEQLIIQRLAVSLERAASKLSIVVVGSTLDDIALLSNKRVFVTGRTDPGEISDSLLPYNVRCILAGFDLPLFGHPSLQSAFKSSLPVAYLDWSFGSIAPRGRNCGIDPRLPFDEIIERLASWTSYVSTIDSK